MNQNRRPRNHSSPRPRILCLHGRQQDGELFSQRLRTLSKSLSEIADLHFATAPHELPLLEGHTVATRAWWRALDQPSGPQPRAAAAAQQHPQEVDHQSGTGGPAQSVSVAAEGVVRDWQASLQVLASEWRSAGPFAGVLGFSNGGAAALLLACHAHTDPSAFPGLQFVILAGAYVPQPLHRLVPPHCTASSSSSTTAAASGGGELHDISPLAAPLPLPSLHFYSDADTAVPVNASLAAAVCFRAADRTLAPHSLGHCLPQKAEHTAVVTAFVRQALLVQSGNASSATPAGDHGSGTRPREQTSARGSDGGGGTAAPTAAAAGPGGEGSVQHGSVVGVRVVDPVVGALAGLSLVNAATSGSGSRAARAPANRGEGQGQGQSGSAPSCSPHARPHPHSNTQRPPTASATTTTKHQHQQQNQQGGMQQTRVPLVMGRASGKAPAAGDRSAAIASSSSLAAAAAASVGNSVGCTTGRATSATAAATAPGQAVKSAETSLGPRGSNPDGGKANTTNKPTSDVGAAEVGVGVSGAGRQKGNGGPATIGQSQCGTGGAATPKAAMTSLAASAPIGVVHSTAGGSEAVEAVDASEEQLEEMDALEAIFMDEYRPISTAPPRFTIHLRDPSSPSQDEDDTAGPPSGPPSRLFSLTFTLPPGYPSTQPPLVSITGPLGNNDPRRHALADHILASAQEAIQGGGGGCVFQLVEAACEWIDTHLPADVGSRRESTHPRPTSATLPAPHLTITTTNTSAVPAASISTMHTPALASAATATSGVGSQPPKPNGANGAISLTATAGGGGTGMTPAAAATALAAAATGPAVMNLGWSATAAGIAASSGTAGTDVWWLREEADPELIRGAVAEAAAAAPWRTGRGEAAEGLGGEAEAAEELHWGNGEGGPDPGSAEWSQRGRWDYVVGLVGKPSAGKSTFFNAVTDPASDEEGARVAAFPFTTIAPNVARGFCLVPDPSPLLGLEQGQARPLHGYAPAFSLEGCDPRTTNIEPLRRWVGAAGWAAAGRPLLWRRVPVVVKDVAGLVPGAYQGRGRGNAFLNDLCDADVLVHVVDVSGSTDREGRLVEGGGGGGGEGEGGGKGGAGGDPLDDVGWVREELHRWVYDNVRTKWVYVLRKPSRLPDLFSGYHASRALVAEVLERVGVSVGSLVVEGASLAHWGEAHLHRVVAHFLQARFPILLALNKADMGSSPEHIARLRHALPYEPAVPVSAASERWLCTQRRAGRVSYADGAGDATPLTDSPELAAQLSKLRLAVLSRYGSTGAALALTCAVAMRPPRPVFPVCNIEGYEALVARGEASGAGGLLGSGLDAKARAAEGGSPSVLRDCVLLKPGSTVVDLYEVLKHPPYQLLEGDFVRAECSARTSPHAVAAQSSGGAAALQPWRVLKKDEVLDWGCCVARVMTNRRINWQARK